MRTTAIATNRWSLAGAFLMALPTTRANPARGQDGPPPSPAEIERRVTMMVRRVGPEARLATPGRAARVQDRGGPPGPAGDAGTTTTTTTPNATSRIAADADLDGRMLHLLEQGDALLLARPGPPPTVDDRRKNLADRLGATAANPYLALYNRVTGQALARFPDAEATALTALVARAVPDGGRPPIQPPIGPSPAPAPTPAADSGATVIEETVQVIEDAAVAIAVPTVPAFDLLAVDTSRLVGTVVARCQARRAARSLNLSSGRRSVRYVVVRP